MQSIFVAEATVQKQKIDRQQEVVYRVKAFQACCIWILLEKK